MKIVFAFIHRRSVAVIVDRPSQNRSDVHYLETFESLEMSRRNRHIFQLISVLLSCHG